MGPEAAMDKMEVNENVFVMNSNYMDEIMEMTDNKFNYILVDEL